LNFGVLVGTVMVHVLVADATTTLGLKVDIIIQRQLELLLVANIQYVQVGFFLVFLLNVLHVMDVVHMLMDII
jgi:hypothetical protein